MTDWPWKRWISAGCALAIVLGVAILLAWAAGPPAAGP
jgi:hypothetical protein